MKNGRLAVALLAVIFCANGKFALAAAPADKAMNDLAMSSGCSLCHRLEPRKAGVQEILPYGPAWRDVAAKYRGDAGAPDRLTRVIRQGSGPNASARHWQFKTSVVEMPPNAVEISEADARQLVGWILSLDSK